MKPTNERPSGWVGILTPDEEILWQGRPDPSLRFTAEGIAGLLFGLFFAGFALVWMILAATAGGFFWMFGLIHFSVGLSVAFGAFFKRPFMNRHTWYSLSNQRAFIATDLPVLGKRLRSYAIDANTSLSMDEGPLSSIHFASETYRHKGRTKTRRIGFNTITDGAHVYALMRDIQRAHRQKDPA